MPHKGRREPILAVHTRFANLIVGRVKVILLGGGLGESVIGAMCLRAYIVLCNSRLCNKISYRVDSEKTLVHGRTASPPSKACGLEITSMYARRDPFPGGQGPQKMFLQ